ncbi:hypothetical protein GFS24_17720 [Chitinophaga sp. SYP-B3965]|uniref:hypothetical protein n=1 Tax=Chitinophaga sp. SYP-B3965 TaxID=2663120 RepID=UPI001299FEAE|nr:hypothetical protein [Chitinophaga sp. SYP-B3965]MRG46965.1 hypothetical protein [Chitinophaga sp. SYP-B3965]
MSKGNDNVLTMRNTGTFGSQIVFRQRHGETIMSKPPKPTNIPLTADQIAVHQKFKAATNYAKAVNANEALKAAYQAVSKPGRTAYNTALADFFKAPEIIEIDRSAYTGLPNSIIRINAIDNFRVESVSVILLDQAGNPIEQGQAVTDPNSHYWIYTAINANQDVPGSTVRVQAADLPGNVTVKDFLL